MKGDTAAERHVESSINTHARWWRC